MRQEEKLKEKSKQKLNESQKEKESEKIPDVENNPSHNELSHKIDTMDMDNSNPNNLGNEMKLN